MATNLQAPKLQLTKHWRS